MSDLSRIFARIIPEPNRAEFARKMAKLAAIRAVETTGNHDLLDHFGGVDERQQLDHETAEMCTEVLLGGLRRAFVAMEYYHEQPPDASNSADVADVADLFLHVLFLLGEAWSGRNALGPLGEAFVLGPVWVWTLGVLVPVMEQAAHQMGIDVGPIILFGSAPQANRPAAMVLARKLLLAARSKLHAEVLSKIRKLGYTGDDCIDDVRVWIDGSAAGSRASSMKCDEANTKAPPATGTAQTRDKGSQFTVATLRDMTGLSNTALNKYAKLAGQATERNGHEK